MPFVPELFSGPALARLEGKWRLDERRLQLSLGLRLPEGKAESEQRFAEAIFDVDGAR
jgi:hypothetical protein